MTKPSQHIRLWRWLIPAVAILAAGGYVAIAFAGGLAGFPLDDAWIHQTYARNLAETGQLAYQPGQPSAGSTSPAWSFLLSVGYLLGLDFRVWAYLLGGLVLATTAWLAYCLFLRLAPRRPVAALLAGLLCAVEWHLVWASVSGMETVLFTALSLALLESYFSHLAIRQATDGPQSLRTEQTLVSAVGIGLLGGVLTVTRPEGLALAGLVIAGLVAFPGPPIRRDLRTRLLAAAIALLALGVALVPYVLFNWNTAGSLFPNTLYAKQAEYQIQGSLLTRFWQVLSPTLVGGQVLLLPGFCYAAYTLVRRRAWPALLPLVWWFGFLAVYAWRLPMVYQHGRYAMPTIPLLIVYGVWGTAKLVQPRSPHLALRVLSRATPAAIALLFILFGARGAIAYRDDVGFIEGEMVAMARWLNEHTAPDDLVAVHDIGAVGYLSERPLLDLAGLITPEVIPFIADAEQLTAWMIEQGAAYAIFFPDFAPAYRQLAADPRFELAHCTNHAWTRAQGHDNLCAWRVVSEKQP